jgi:hypothetical protein
MYGSPAKGLLLRPFFKGRLLVSTRSRPLIMVDGKRDHLCSNAGRKQ